MLRSRTIVLVVVGWLVAAVGLDAVGVLRTLRPPAPQLILVALTVLLLAAAWRVAGLRAWLAAVDLR